MANVVVSAIATFNGKALKKGKKEISAFDKQAQKLGKTFTKVFAAAALLNFGKNAVNAFIDSEKAAAKLRTTVSNLGLQYEQPGIEKYLDKLSLQFGIVNENLIPGFQRLITVTKDVATAQSLFETALNVSAGTGQDLTAVSTSLSKAYLGDNAALGKLGIGLTKAQLKSASFLELQNILNVNFAGQAAAAVEGYAGSMAKLTVAVDKSKEAIGKGLLDALAALSGSNDIDTFTVKMVNAAEKIGNAFRTVGDVIGLLNPNASVKVGGKFLRKSDMNAPRLSPATSRAILLRQETTQIKTGVTLRKAENEQLKKKTAVDALRDKFDLERIGLTAALNSATDDETKLRLRAQLAILDNNEALAKKLLAELEAAEALKKLTDAAGKLTTSFEQMLEVLRGSIRSILDSVKPEVKSLQTITNPTQENLRVSIAAILESTKPAQNALQNLINPSEENLRRTIADSLAAAKPTVDMLNLLTSGALAQRASTSGPMDVRLTIDGGSDKLSQAIAESIQLATRSGYSTVPNGFLV